jgi:hypothetical protein
VVSSDSSTRKQQRRLEKIFHSSIHFEFFTRQLFFFFHYFLVLSFKIQAVIMLFRVLIAITCITFASSLYVGPITISQDTTWSGERDYILDSYLNFTNGAKLSVIGGVILSQLEFNNILYIGGHGSLYIYGNTTNPGLLHSLNAVVSNITIAMSNVTIQSCNWTLNAVVSIKASIIVGRY